MSIPTWYDIQKTPAYKEGRREVEGMIRQMITSLESQLAATQRAVEEQGNTIVELEAEVARLKQKHGK